MYQLTESMMRAALHELADKDALMAGLFQQFGVPPLLEREQTFATLVHIVLEQKVSLDSANAVMRRLVALCPAMTPADFLKIPVKRLREAGLSASKMSYCCSIADSLLTGTLDLAGLERLDDEQVMEQLCRARGIGPWTAGVYLMMALRRPDAWASGDRALVVSYTECAQLEAEPTYAQMDKLAQRWAPHRGTAARLLWHAYLQKRGRSVAVSE